MCESFIHSLVFHKFLLSNNIAEHSFTIFYLFFYQLMDDRLLLGRDQVMNIHLQVLCKGKYIIFLEYILEQNCETIQFLHVVGKWVVLGKKKSRMR